MKHTKFLIKWILFVFKILFISIAVIITSPIFIPGIIGLYLWCLLRSLNDWSNDSDEDNDLKKHIAWNCNSWDIPYPDNWWK